jgi:5,10-methylene-tetrahydrofolate dehydrogenase/methenyl tetrahydrofolate cyclohydrolase
MNESKTLLKEENGTNTSCGRQISNRDEILWESKFVIIKEFTENFMKGIYVNRVFLIFDEATKIIEELIGDEARSVFEKRFRHEISRLTGVLA